MIKSLENLGVKADEYCFLLEESDQYNKSFKVNIPKFMPMFSIDEIPKSNNIVFDTNIFSNDDSCKPIVNKSILTQNYVSLERFRNTNFRFHPSNIHKKTRFICKIVDGNLRNMGITDDELNLDQVDSNSKIFIRNPLHEIIDRIKVGDEVKFADGVGGADNSYSILTGNVAQINDWGVIVTLPPVHDVPYGVLSSHIIGVYTTTGTYKNNIRGDY